jgi:hypothetical protein
MKRNLFLIIFFLCIIGAKAQNSEIGVFVGNSYYLGDLNPSTQFGGAQSAGGILYRYNFNPRWAFKFSALFGSVTGSDKGTNANNPRNLSFRSPISELSAQVELNFFQLYTANDKNHFSPYIFAGFSVFSFNPQARNIDPMADSKDHWYDLQPLGTEGQGLDGQPGRYSLTSFSIPFGLGIKVNFLHNFSFGAEWGIRKTFTDYLDDVSTTYYDPEILMLQRSDATAQLADPSEIKHITGSARGNSTTKDWYSFAGIWLTFKLFDNNANCPAYEKSKFHGKRKSKK